ncbi:hypothetical protein HNP55_003762 [Paucibacter oligotrophus]|uniref:Uncharacterized protein n=1 Tax=Roseateles oligotrophus TaxID=1769250 RepID=A0A840LE17_9BURK|nr:hypothetical protein [Roseateles oligotrophus]MBB4845215.1 hypothetical protein [Roseateles oligotrophus]
MSSPPLFTGSTWFVTFVAILVALGAQVLIGALTPIVAFDWLFGEMRRQGPVVLIAGESFWREDAVIRALAFTLGAFVACLLARTHSWQLLASLVAVFLVATAFAQFPRPVLTWQLVLWASAAPAGALLAWGFFRAWKGAA